MLYINIWPLKGKSEKKCEHCGTAVGKLRIDVWSGKTYTYCSVDCIRAELNESIESAIQHAEKKEPGQRYEWSR